MQQHFAGGGLFLWPTKATSNAPVHSLIWRHLYLNSMKNRTTIMEQVLLRDGKSKMQVMLITLHHHWLATIFAETTSTEDWNFWCILIPFCVQKTRPKLRFACFHLATVFFIIFYRTEICIRLYNLGNLFSSTSYKNYSATQNLGAAT